MIVFSQRAKHKNFSISCQQMHNDWLGTLWEGCSLSAQLQHVSSAQLHLANSAVSSRAVCQLSCNGKLSCQLRWNWSAQLPSVSCLEPLPSFLGTAGGLEGGLALSIVPTLQGWSITAQKCVLHYCTCEISWNWGLYQAPHPRYSGISWI